MKKAVAVVLALSLGGCAGLHNYNNPITKDTLYEVENTMIIAFAALKAYKQSCKAGAIAQVCKNNIIKVQVYSRRIPTLVKQLRGFVKNNDQVNARIVYDSIVTLVNQLQADATAATGVK